MQIEVTEKEAKEILLYRKWRAIPRSKRLTAYLPFVIGLIAGVAMCGVINKLWALAPAIAIIFAVGIWSSKLEDKLKKPIEQEVSRELGATAPQAVERT